jgi:metal-responsive CopG/Arc/MetJ family transcriptional regulator
MKIAVSLPDELFRQADDMAARLGLSRSQVYARALEEFLDAHGGDHDPITARLNELADHNESTAVAAAVGVAAGRQLIATGQWEW